jgi:mono/diheme cytochrome c family protein
MKSLMLPILSLLVAVNMSACSWDKSKPNVEVIQDMMESPAIKAQEYDESSPGHSGMRLPPENTAPVGFTPYKMTFDQAQRELKNPLAGDMSKDVLMTGQKFYVTNCAVCHGTNGEGSANSSVGQLMALKPPSMLTEKIRGWNDAQIYHTITMGQGLMGPYASHIPQKYRWQVVNYIRFLQSENGK